VIDNLLKNFIQPLQSQNIESIVLGCTHYPLIREAISSSIGDKIQLIDSGEAVAREVKKQLMKNNIYSDIKELRKLQIYTSKSKEELKNYSEA